MGHVRAILSFEMEEHAPLLGGRRSRGRLAPLVSLLAAVAVTLAASAAVRPVRRAVSAATGGAVGAARFGVESFEVVDSGHRNRLARRFGGCRRFDVADFIRQVARPDDFLVLKMDVEGFEYRVLDSLRARGVAKYIDEMMVEFHFASAHEHRKHCIFRKEV